MGMNYIFSRVCNALFKTSLKRLWGAHELFELNLTSATTFPVICRIGFITGKNLLYSFPNSMRSPKIPKKEDVDELVTELEKAIEDMIFSKKYLADPNNYVQTILTWMFFLVIRRCFDFNLYLRDVNPNDEVFKRQLNLWEFLTTVISKVWFFELLVELRSRSEAYFRVLENMKLGLNEFKDAEMDKLLSELRGGDYGVPAYASEGEIVILRVMNADEMLGTFIDTNKPWIRDLHKIVSYGNYRLRYQYPYGCKISSYPVEVALSFKSPSFLDDHLGDWFGETGLEHPFSKLKKD
jgi:hypothetical protein